MTASGPASIAPILAGLEDVSPVFVQRFLHERGIVPGKGYTKAQQIARLGRMVGDGDLQPEQLRDLLIDWQESGQKHVFAVRIEAAAAKGAAQKCAALPQLPYLPPTINSAAPSVLYGVADSSVVKVVHGEKHTEHRVNQEATDIETVILDRRTVIEIDVAAKVASIALDPPRGRSTHADVDAYYGYYQEWLIAFLGGAATTIDLAAAMLAIEQTDLVRVESSRSVDEEQVTVQMSSPTELRGRDSYKKVRANLKIREAGRYRWVEGSTVQAWGAPLSLARDVRADIDASAGMIRLPSQTTALERRYILAQISAHG
jgi:hypothetical protein